MLELKGKPEKERVPGTLLAVEVFIFSDFFLFIFPFLVIFNTLFLLFMCGVHFARDGARGGVSEPCEWFARVKSHN